MPVVGCLFVHFFTFFLRRKKDKVNLGLRGDGWRVRANSPQDIDRLACLGEDKRFGLGVAIGAGLVPDGCGAEGPGGQCESCAGCPRAQQCCAQTTGCWPSRCHGEVLAGTLELVVRGLSTVLFMPSSGFSSPGLTFGPTAE